MHIPQTCHGNNEVLMRGFISSRDRCKSSLNINTEYADDCGNIIISDNKVIVNYLKYTIPRKLKLYNLICNEMRNEERVVIMKIEKMDHGELANI